MGIFQEQFNSTLRNAVSAKFTSAIVGQIEKDAVAQKDLTAEHRESLPDKYATHLTKMLTKAQEDDIMSMDAETLGEVSATLTMQARKIAEQQRGIDAQKATTIGMVNKLMSQGHAKRTKTLKQWQKDLTGGNE